VAVASPVRGGGLVRDYLRAEPAWRLPPPRRGGGDVNDAAATSVPPVRRSVTRTWTDRFGVRWVERDLGGGRVELTDGRRV
jgi:hypothetical protein